MKMSLERLVFSCVAALVVFYVATHHYQHTAPLQPHGGALSQAPDDVYNEAREVQQGMTTPGPLAKYVTHLKPMKAATVQPVSGYASKDVPEAVSLPGTSRQLLHETFSLSRIVELTFVVPPHAETPHLRGTYHSLLLNAGSSDAKPDIEFMLLNQQQYADFLNEHPGDALFSADDSPDQDVDVLLPPTFSRPATYHAVFRNNTEDVKKSVQANFHLEF
ncbi:MAG TPA: hypothetical protein VMD76_11270 [Candidatus Sulfotelmatobacter sp.]|jgi:hypothetical protein|nr:hypothetical protein [Candidatus Sulfotelmatobacter sp.]